MVDPRAVPDALRGPARLWTRVQLWTWGRSWTRGRLWTWGLLALILLFAAAVRLRLLGVPLERDEGEYAYAGQLILQGIPPYRLVYNMKLPGTYAAYAVVMALFGQSIGGIHLGLLLVNAATIVLEFILVRRLFGEYAGVVAAASYALLSVGQPVYGVFAHATHFVVLPALAGLLLLLRGLDSGRLRTFFLSGLLLGLGFVMKQHGLFFVLFGLVYLVWERLRAGARAPSLAGEPAREAAQAEGGGLGRRSLARRLGRETAVFAIGAALPFGVTCLVLALAGVFDNFWFWTIRYAATYVTEQPWSVLMIVLSEALERVVAPTALLWGTAGLGLVALVAGGADRGRRAFALGFLLFSCASVCPGLYFRQHYFVLLLPAVSLFAGLAVDALRRALAEAGRVAAAPALAGCLFLVVVLLTIAPQSKFLFAATPREASRATYGPSPFPEAPQIARYLAARTSEGETIAVLGSEPEIFFYAHRRSATGYIYMYGLMEEQPYALTMQQAMIREIEAAAPEYLVLVNMSPSWTARPHSTRLVFEWYDRYTRDDFERVGLVDVVSADETDYFWDEEAAGRSPRSAYYVEILKRKPIF